MQSLESLEGVRVVVVGDFMLDRYTWGAAERISPEAPVVVVRVNNEEWRLGGAGNVVANLARVGACPIAVGLVGGDEEGDRLIDLLKSEGADVSGIVRDAGRQTTSKNRIVANAQQVVRVDHEDTNQLSIKTEKSLKQSLDKALSSAGGLIVSDYGKGVWNTGLSGTLSDVGRKIPALVDPKPINRELYHGADLLTPNRTEAEFLSGINIESVEDAIRAGKKIISEMDLGACLVTLGSKGMLLCNATGEWEHIETDARKVFDVSGAGDTVIALTGLAISAGWKISNAAKLANIAAGLVVEEVGTVPVDSKKLKDRLEV